MSSVIQDPQLSLVIPMYNEAGNIAPLLSETAAAFDGFSYEIIVVDDASDDGSAEEVLAAGATVRLLTHSRRSGKSRALMTAFRAARGRWIATLDGDGQNDPSDIAEIMRLYADKTPDFIVAGVRNRRNDGWVKFLTSRVANFIRVRLLRDDCRDAGCGVKVLPTAFARELPYFDNMHRFLPALARRAGLSVLEQKISDRPRQHGQSKYGFFDRAAVAFLDVMGVYWLIRRVSHPGEIKERAIPAGEGPEPSVKVAETTGN